MSARLLCRVGVMPCSGRCAFWTPWLSICHVAPPHRAARVDPAVPALLRCAPAVSMPHRTGCQQSHGDVDVRAAAVQPSLCCSPVLSGLARAMSWPVTGDCTCLCARWAGIIRTRRGPCATQQANDFLCTFARGRTRGGHSGWSRHAHWRCVCRWRGRRAVRR